MKHPAAWTVPAIMIVLLLAASFEAQVQTREPPPFPPTCPPVCAVCLSAFPRVSGPAAGAYMEVDTEKCAAQLLMEGALSDMGCHCWVIATVWE